MFSSFNSFLVAHFGIAKLMHQKIENHRMNVLIEQTQKMQTMALPKLKNKEVIKCVFFALDRSVWKYDSVFKRMMKHKRFDPVVLVCPVVNYGRRCMLQKMEEAYQCYKEKGYPTIKSYDVENDKYIDVRKDLNPDMIVYTNPYKGLIDDRYYVTNYLDILSFYVHYGFNSVTKWDMLYKQPLTNLVWRYYIESPIHLNYVQEHSLNKGVNGVVSGYPGIEDLIDPTYRIKADPWIIKERRIKRIIWAPHHSIEADDVVHFSNFLRYANFMMDLAKKYSDHIQIAFKPHPFLKNNLINRWGREKTEQYYNEWDLMPNTFFTDGEYIDLFLTSDAMIHDSGSFLIEYLFTQKPVMRMMNDDCMDDLLNGYAKRCFDVYYKGYDEAEVEQFVVNVIEGKDENKEYRERLYNEFLLPQNGKMPSENIISDILDSIDNQLLFIR